jgi:hypothetical protein
MWLNLVGRLLHKLAFMVPVDTLYAMATPLRGVRIGNDVSCTERDDW